MIKMAMLAATAAVVVWVGWPVEEDRSGRDSVSADQESSRSTRVADADAPAFDPSTKTVSGTTDRRLDINRATVEQFEGLPGIGPALAQRIVEERKARGPFRSIEDLRNVKGLGEKRLKRLRPLLIASPANSRITGAGSHNPVPAERERRAHGMNGL